jgi:hypothetical protein
VSDSGPAAARRTVRRRGGRALRIALVAVVLTPMLASGCASGSWGGARLADLGDVLDVRHGRSMGLGAKVEATLWLGAGLGFGRLESVHESYGRHVVERGDDGLFMHLLLFGADGHGGPCFGPPDALGFHILGFNLTALAESADPPPLGRFRFGGELLLPFVHGGLYLNLGEVLDLAGGLVGFDPAHDDVEHDRRVDAG